MIITIVFILFIFLLLLPFLPGIVELVKQEDAEPLFISMDYMRHPRYFGNSFKDLLHQSLKEISIGPGIYEVKLSKPEKLQICKSLEIDDRYQVDHLLYVQGNLDAGNQVLFNKEIYATGDVCLGSGSIVQAARTEGSLKLYEGSRIRRWLDAEGDVRIGKNCYLGISATSGSAMTLSENCKFRRLFAMPICTGENPHHDDGFMVTEALSAAAPASFIKRKEASMPSGSDIRDNIVFPQDIVIRSNSIIRGSVKSYGHIVLEANVTIKGNVIADGDIHIGRHARIGGHVFSQGAVYISSNAMVSSPDKIKSVIGKKSIRIEKNVTIFGYVSTEGIGIVQ